MYSKAIVPLIAISILIGYADDSEARRNRGGRGEAVQSTSSQDTRLRAKFEDQSDDALDDADLAPEFHADYRIKKGTPELKVRVENLELGTIVDVYIENLLIGSAEVVQDDVGTEAALDFRRGDWPTGLPMELSAGMVVRIMVGDTLIFEAPFEVK